VRQAVLPLRFLPVKMAFLHLASVSPVVDIDADSSVAAHKVLRKIDEPYDRASAEVNALGLSLLDREGKCAGAPPLIGLGRAESTGAG
jgi:hypothetical protein